MSSLSLPEVLFGVFSLFIDCGWTKAADFLEVFRKFGRNLELTGRRFEHLQTCKVWWAFCPASCHPPKIILKQWRHSLKGGDYHENPVFPHGIQERSLFILVRDDQPFADLPLAHVSGDLGFLTGKNHFPCYLPLHQQTNASLTSQITKLGPL